MGLATNYWNSLTSTEKDWFSLAPGEKLVDYFDGNMNDGVTNITYGSTNYSDASVSSLIANNAAVFNKLMNDNGQMDLIMKVSSSTGDIQGTFTSTGSGSGTYYMKSKDITEYVGPQPVPPKRCPLCTTS